MLLDQSLPKLDVLPSADEFERWVAELSSARQSCQDAVAAADEGLIEQLRAADEDVVRSLSAAAVDYGRKLSSARTGVDGLVVRVITDMLAGRDARWAQLRSTLDASLARIEELGPACLGHVVSGLESHGLLEVQQDAEGLREHLQSGRQSGQLPASRGSGEAGEVHRGGSPGRRAGSHFFGGARRVHRLA